MEKKNYLVNLYKNFPTGFELKGRKDPDKCSKELYADFIKVYFSDEDKNKDFGLVSIINKGKRYPPDPRFYTLILKTNHRDSILLSADYIGPSVYWCKKLSGLNENDIIEILKKSRTFGGHIFWPRGFQPTINQSRGGKRKFYDRVDWTFLMISAYYSLRLETGEFKGFDEFICKIIQLIPLDSEKISLEKERFFDMYCALEKSSAWLDKLKTFKGFCDFFRLTGNFVDLNYQVMELSSYFPVAPENYNDYISNTINAIQKRNKCF